MDARTDRILDLRLHLSLNLWLFYLTIRSKKLNNEVKKRGGGFSKICALSPQLQEFIGVTELARTEVYLKRYSGVSSDCYLVIWSFRN